VSRSKRRPRESPAALDVTRLFARELQRTHEAQVDAIELYHDEAAAWALGKLWHRICDLWIEAVARVEGREPPT
jgi:hypothetical protein